MTEDENEPTWLAAFLPEGTRKKTNIIELIGRAMSTFEEPLLSRWVAAVNANQFDMRLLTPEPDLDPEDKSIPDEKFDFGVLVELTDEGEYSSIRFPFSSIGRYVEIPDDLSTLPDDEES